jgi:acetyl esterase/lipase
MLVGNLLKDGAAFYLNGADARSPLASPLYGDLAGLPPLLIHVGKAEVLRDDSTRFAARAADAGVAVTLKVWDGVPHVWQLFQFMLPEARAAMDEAAAFAKNHAGAAGLR